MRVHRSSALLAVIVFVTAAGCAAPLSQRERPTLGDGALLGNELETRERRDIEADREIRAHEREIRRQRAEIAEIRRREGYDSYDRYDDGYYDRYDDRHDDPY